MKLLPFAAAVAGIVLSVGVAAAYHPADRSERWVQEPEQRERIDFEDVQRGLFRGGSTAATVRQSARAAGQTSHDRPPYLTEHHTR